jgi:hypothetical protein
MLQIFLADNNAVFEFIQAHPVKRQLFKPQTYCNNPELYKISTFVPISLIPAEHNQNFHKASDLLEDDPTRHTRKEQENPMSGLSPVRHIAAVTRSHPGAVGS